MSCEVQKIRDSQRQFFSARKQIAKAAIQKTSTYIGMEMVDLDSDEERESYYSNASQASTKFSSSYSERRFHVTTYKQSKTNIVVPSRPAWNRDRKLSVPERWGNLWENERKD